MSLFSVPRVLLLFACTCLLFLEVHLPEEIQRRAQKVERRQELSGKAKDYQTRCAEVSQEIR